MQGLWERGSSSPFFGGGCGGLHDGEVPGGGDLVGTLGERDFVRRLDDASNLDGGLEQGKVLFLELEERDVVGDLVGNGIHSLAGVGCAGESTGNLCRGKDFVDIVSELIS